MEARRHCKCDDVFKPLLADGGDQSLDFLPGAEGGGLLRDYRLPQARKRVLGDQIPADRSVEARLEGPQIDIYSDWSDSLRIL
jgi:hypothetical protein